jgi:hypothetical protein
MFHNQSIKRIFYISMETVLSNEGVIEAQITVRDQQKFAGGQSI